MLKHKRLANSSSASPLPKGIIQSSTKSLGEPPQYIQFPTPFLADNGGEEGDGIGEAGCDGSNTGEPEEVRGMMAEVVGKLFAEGIGGTIAVYATAVPHDTIAVLQVPADTPRGSGICSTLQVAVAMLPK
jgi:hypothetical protein